MTARLAPALLAVALLVSGCVIGDNGDSASESGLEGRLPTPTYEPATTSSSKPSPVNGSGGSDTSTTDPGGATATPEPSGGGPETSAVIRDEVGDPSLVPLAERPAWADLTGAELRRSDSGYILRIRLAAPPPEIAPDAEHTMNIATFADVDGDGTVDYEVWVTLADDGWGPGYFDNRRDRAAYAGSAGVSVAVTGGELVLRFGLRHLDGAEQLRWSLASEWGRYEAIGTPAMSRDQAPDGGRPQDFPS